MIMSGEGIVLPVLSANVAVYILAKVSGLAYIFFLDNSSG